MVDLGEVLLLTYSLRPRPLSDFWTKIVTNTCTPLAAVLFILTGSINSYNHNEHSVFLSLKSISIYSTLVMSHATDNVLSPGERGKGGGGGDSDMKMIGCLSYLFRDQNL